MSAQQVWQTSDTISPAALFFGASAGWIELSAEVAITQAVEDKLASADNL